MQCMLAVNYQSMLRNIPEE